MHLARGTVSVRPFRIGLPATVAWRFSILQHLTDAPFQTDPEQLLRLDRELHRQLLQHFAGEAVDDQRDRASCVEAARSSRRTTGPR